MRKDKINYYLDMADAATGRATCLRRIFGAIIVKNDEIVSTGYNGAPRGRENCCDCGKCIRQELGVKRGERYELCRSVHAEANCIISAARRDMIDSTLYLVGREVETGAYVENTAPCAMCKRLIINAGIEKVVTRIAGGKVVVTPVQQWIDEDDSLIGERA